MFLSTYLHVVLFTLGESELFNNIHRGKESHAAQILGFLVSFASLLPQSRSDYR